MIFVLDLLLLLGAFVSVNIAVAWGKLASHPRGGDLSKLAGIGNVPLLMMLRWPILAIGLVTGASRYGFRDLPGTRRGPVAIVLFVHFVLGLVSYWVFQRAVKRVERGDSGPAVLAWGFGAILPVAAFIVALYGVHFGWIGRHPWIAVTCFALLAVAHYLALRKGSERPT